MPKHAKQLAQRIGAIRRDVGLPPIVEATTFAQPTTALGDQFADDRGRAKALIHRPGRSHDRSWGTRLLRRDAPDGEDRSVVSGMTLSGATAEGKGETISVHHRPPRFHADTQFSSCKPFTRLNSRSLLVTSVAFNASACAAINRSIGPISRPRSMRSHFTRA